MSHDPLLSFSSKLHKKWYVLHILHFHYLQFFLNLIESFQQFDWFLGNNGGGYGAPPPADDGYGAPPADDGYGAPAPADDGYGAPAPADDGYGAPTPADNSYGAPA